MITKRSKNRTGSLTIEVALCLPVLILLLFGCYELARTNMILHGTQSAAYEGARTGIIPGATPEKIEQSVGFVLRTIGVQDFQVEIIPADIQRDTESVEVIVRVPVANNLSLPRLFVEDPTFKGTCKLSREIP
jgi:Flp pilus assembly protein TadG